MNNTNSNNINDTNNSNNNNSMNYKKIFKRETKVIVFVVICLALAALGTSYAVFLQTNNNKDNQVVKAGSLIITYKNNREENNGTLTQDSDDDDKNCLAPKTDEEGRASGCEINFSIENAGSLPAQYNLLIYNNPKSNLKIESAEENQTLVALQYFKYSLTKASTSKGGSAGEKQNIGLEEENGAAKKLSDLEKYKENSESYSSEDTSEYEGASILDNAKIEVGEKIDFTLRIWLVNDASKDLIRNPVDLKLGVIDLVYENETAGDTVLASMGKENGIHEIMPVPSETTPIDTEDETSKIREFRYSGQNPNNYVSFNCQDDDTCETWRILGVTEEDKDGATERTVKLVNASKTYSLTYQPDTGIQLTLESEGLTEIAQKQIINTTYKIGTTYDPSWTGSQMLDNERNSNTSITSSIGILTISDYMLASSDWESATLSSFAASQDNSYLYNTTDERLLDKNGSDGYYMIAGTSHMFTTISDAEQSYNEHIVVTLNKDVKITKGTGTQDDPYVLSN